MVIATQNPVDLDYKAMANAGSWFIGRLQTERDKERVLEGLRSAAGGVDVAALDTAIGGLEQRQFLLQSSHRDKPELFSHPLGDVVPARPADEGADRDADARGGAAAEDESVQSRPRALSRDDESAVAPPVADGIPVRWLDPAAPWAAEVGADPAGKRLQAFLAARVSLRFDDTKADLDTTQEWEARLRPARHRPRPRPRDGRRLRRPRPARRAAGRRAPTCSRRPARQGVLLPRRRPRDPAARDRHADARAAPQRRARPLLAPGRDGGAVRRARRRGGESRRRRRDGEDPRPPGDEARPARARARNRAPAGRAGLASSRARAATPSSSPASAASSACSSAARRTRARSRAPGGRSAAPPAGAA